MLLLRETLDDSQDLGRVNQRQPGFVRPSAGRVVQLADNPKARIVYAHQPVAVTTGVSSTEFIFDAWNGAMTVVGK